MMFAVTCSMNVQELELVLARIMLDHLQSFFSAIGGKLIDLELDKVRSSKFSLDNMERNLKTLSCRASDIEKQIKNGELSGKRKRKREVENWLEEVQIIESEFLTWRHSMKEEGFIRRLFSGQRTQKMNSRVEDLIQQSYGFGEVVVLDAAEANKGQPWLTTRLFGKAFDENLRSIWECLVVTKVPIIGIYGMGGVGKTTLVKHLHNLLIEKNHYQVCWITVSQQFRVTKLQDAIAKFINLSFSDDEDEEKRAVELHQALSGRKDLVLILDDMWEYINLEKLGDPLRVTGCSLIVTTRLLQVCQRIGCRKKIEVKNLQENEAWNLFKETLGGAIRLHNTEVQTIAKSMVKECAGLPLGIITLARSMKEVTDVHEWRNARAELKEYPMEQDDMRNEVFRILKYSFDRLDADNLQEERRNGYTKIQRCFLYCCLYPEDYKLQRFEIISKFISEGLLDKRKSRKEEFDQGYAILNRLVSVSLLESEDEGSIVKMHDLIRAMALKITGCNPTKFLVRAQLQLQEIPSEEEWMSDLEKVSLMHNNISEIEPSTSPSCPKLSTLLLNENPLKFIPESFFRKMHGLSILDLSYTRVKKLPHSLSNLERLNVLRLRECMMLASLPCLGKLKGLTELDLMRTKINEIPRGMKNLVKLKLLCMWGMKELKDLPKGFLSRFSYLQHLSLPSHIKPPVEEIGMLRRLEEFSGTFTDVSEFNQFVRCRNTHGSLSFCDIKVGKVSNTWEVYNYIEEKFGGKRVVIEQCSFSSKETMIMVPEFTQHLVLSNCKGLSENLVDDLLKLNNPKSLQICEISNCDGIQCISMVKEGDDEEDSCKLLYFQEFWLLGLSNLTDVVKWEKGVSKHSMFSFLKKLHIEDCHQIKNLGLPLMDFRKIEEIIIVRCEKVEEIVELGDDGKRGPIFLPKLKLLCLAMLPGLKRICKATIACKSIEEIDLYSCPNLEKLGLHIHFVDGKLTSPRSLKQIRMYPKDQEWWESLMWDDYQHGHLLQPLVRFW